MCPSVPEITTRSNSIFSSNAWGRNSNWSRTENFEEQQSGSPMTKIAYLYESKRRFLSAPFLQNYNHYGSIRRKNNPVRSALGNPFATNRRFAQWTPARPVNRRFRAR